MGHREAPAADYDDFLYSDFPHAETHPSRLYALGRLFGLTPADPARCRVLELGCGLGGNLLAMSASLPNSKFLGIDQSARQIAVGADKLRALQIDNIVLLAKDLQDFQTDERFDYVICHGLYSWVPACVQARILAIARAHLAQMGLCYISYNTLPGWHMRGLLRDLLRRAAGDAGSPEERIGRARRLLTFLENLPEEQDPAQAFLAAEVRLLAQLGDEYLFYEHLVSHNQPIYFEEFAKAAEQAGLCYVTDAQFAVALPARASAQALAAARGEDIIQTEQRLDLLEVRFFRRSLLCHKEAGVGLDPLRAPSFARLQGLQISTSLVPLEDESDLGSDAIEDFRGPSSRGVEVHRPTLKAALRLLYDERPQGLEFDALCDLAWARVQGAQGRRVSRRAPKRVRAEIGTSLLDLMARGFLELRAPLPSAVPRPGPRPKTTALVRLQAGRGQAGCTNLRGESIAVDDLDRCLLRRLDGSYSLEELGELLLIDTRAGGFTLEMDGKPVTGREAMTRAADKRLQHLARSAFLLA